MAITNLAAVLQDKIYQDWLKSLEKNIITNTAKELRGSQQTSAKTDFSITKSTVKDLFKTIANYKIDDSTAQDFLNILLTGNSDGLVGPEGLRKGESFIKVNGEDAVLLQNIGFDTISTRLNQVLDEYPQVGVAMQNAEETYYDQKLKELNARTDLDSKAKKAEFEKIQRDAAERATLGYYFNKGHVIGVSTNLTRQFRNKLANANVLAEDQRKLLLNVLDQYIDKMIQDDLNSANLPDAVNQELYVKYTTKTTEKYLVELQHRLVNQGGTAAGARAVTQELSKVFSGNAPNLAQIIAQSPTIGATLLQTHGSPTFTSMLAKELAAEMTGKQKDKTVYTGKSTLVGKKTTKIKKPKNHKQDIQKLKQIKQKLQSTKPDPSAIKVVPEPEIGINLVNLQELINNQIEQAIKRNMGTGNSRSVLNYRSGRFASSVRAERLVESKSGMITAFYSYMKNPYQTFEPGFAQGVPESRSPRLLIAKSIRDIAAETVSNRLRSVLV